MDPYPLAYEAYQSLADDSAARIDHKPHNTYYEKPAMVSMLPNLAGKRVLDAGCGPGVYTEAFLNRGASVIAIDASDRMLYLAKKRMATLENQNVEWWQEDLSQPIDFIEDESLDHVHASLCMDYIENWYQTMAEFSRILKPNGTFQFSCGHPAFDAQYYETQDYFSVEQVQCTWRGFGKTVEMPSYRRSLTEIIAPILSAKLRIEQVVEPLPTEEFRKSDPIRYARLLHRPCFLCLLARKPSSPST